MHLRLSLLILTLIQLCSINAFERSYYETRDSKDDLSIVHDNSDNDAYLHFDTKEIEPADEVDTFEHFLIPDVPDDWQTPIFQRDLEDKISNLELILRDLYSRALPRTRVSKTGSRSPSPVRSVDLQVIPYDRGNHPVTGRRQPCHWAIFAHTGPGESGTAYQLKGMPGAFRYDGPEKGITPSHSSRKRQEVDIGRVPSDRMRDMEAIIASVPISRSENDYNCQTWTEDVLTAMQPHGWLDLTPSAVAQWLKGMEA